MKASTVQINGKTHVKIEHNDSSVNFSISMYTSKHYAQGYDVFEQINGYWKYLAEDKQKRIYDLYEEIMYVFQSTMSQRDTYGALNEKIKLLMAEHDLEHMYYWLTVKNDVYIPENIPRDYAHDINNNTSREKTYVVSDYKWLCALSLALRVVMPVLVNHIGGMGERAGTRHKEYEAFRLVHGTALMECPAMVKLRTYVESIVGADNFNSASILQGISSEDYVPWLLAMVCIRRLAIADIGGQRREDKTNANLMIVLYKFLIQKVRNNPGDQENNVKDKKHNDEGVGENKISTLERYKIKTDLSLGEIVELEYSVSDLENVAWRLSPLITKEMLADALKSSMELENHELIPVHVTLLKWLMKPVISPRGIMYLPKSTVIKLLAVGQCYLRTLGFHELALIITSVRQVQHGDIEETRQSPVDFKQAIDPVDMEKLVRYFPYKLTRENKEIYPVMEGINSVTMGIIANNLQATASDAVLMEITGRKLRTIIPGDDLRIRLAKLVLALATITNT